MWTPFAKDGRLANSDTSWVSDSEKLAGAIAVRFTLQPGEKKIIPMVISWDLPVVQFGQGRKWNRRYTDFYGTTGQQCLEDRPRRPAECRAVERCHRQVAGALRQ